LLNLVGSAAIVARAPFEWGKSTTNGIVDLGKVELAEAVSLGECRREVAGPLAENQEVRE
jgi:hypothetical protein